MKGMDVNGMVNISFPVSEISSGRASGSGVATRIGVDGMELRSRDVPPSQFVWIGFTPPGAGRSIKLLGEVMGLRRDGAIDSVIVRFKHMFPADRQILFGLIASRAAA